MQLKRITVIMTIFTFLTILAHAQAGKIECLWPNAEDAVMYELEVATVAVNEDVRAIPKQVVYTTTSIFTAGVQLPLSLFEGQDLKKLYFRARPLDLDKNPVGSFSKPEVLSKMSLNPSKPTPTALYTDRPLPLYPVYSWIPVEGATKYEIEITDQWPESPNGTEPSKHRIRSYSLQQQGFDFYDPEPLINEGIYYWRVLAYDKDNRPIGLYSDPALLKVKTGSYEWATFGDSITHGGGAISNPPSDARFDYSIYLPYKVKNLGKSGDTAETLEERFDQEVLPFKPKYLLIMGGSNSIRGGTSASDVIESLSAISKKCQNNNIRPIFLTLPPINPDRIQRVFNEETIPNWKTELAKVNAFIKKQPDYVDIYPSLVDEQGLLPVKYAQDGLHLDISGKKIIGHKVSDYIKEHSL
ncbi:hypothetical protein SPSIL_013210 [Sporomusa silvacetica DSM 10669]|uniref:SGNH hydrolase-type esterase domain-containing protein n=1 Tax=Sporomusa silvacetica DSM 10669 TaxID=1123289 RepID=A0ABZ3IHQ9_9FIRM|nr:GDSL-type esterase/lipase family protein [Sporomusa silvacetica]OZC16805.1 GDSL-like lipase/acylhydrolase [Sporomusa silvacetica DSM 10669]